MCWLIRWERAPTERGKFQFRDGGKVVEPRGRYRPEQDVKGSHAHSIVVFSSSVPGSSSVVSPAVFSDSRCLRSRLRREMLERR